MQPKHRKIRRRIIGGAGLAAAVVAAAGIAMFGIGLSSASSAPFSTQYSEFLSGYVAASPQRLVDVHSNPSLPDPGTAVGADSLAVGNVLAQSSDGGDEVAIGFVWDNTEVQDDPLGQSTPACGAGEWQLMAGSEAGVDGLLPVQLSDLDYNVAFAGGPVCEAPGSSSYIAVYQSTRFGLVNLTWGPAENDASVVAQFDPGFGDPEFFAAGVGIDTSTAAGAEALQGTVFGFAGPGNGLTILTRKADGSPQQRVTFDTFPLIEVIGTENGGAPTTSNLTTLQPGPIGTGSSFAVTVPSLP